MKLNLGGKFLRLTKLKIKMKRKSTMSKHGSKKMPKLPKLPTYAFGSYVTNPDDAIIKNQIALAKAAQEAKSNPWVQGLNIAGGLAQQIGSSMMSGSGAGETTLGGGVASDSGLGGLLNKFFANNGQETLGLAGILGNMFAFGGQVGTTPSEVEGEEVGELPNGNVVQFNGPSHENGGIPVNLPVGTEMYSKRIKIDGVSLANRKKKREKNSVTLEELLEGNPTDALLKNSLKRTRQVNTKEETFDNNIQEVVNEILTPRQNKFAYGGSNLPFSLLTGILGNGDDERLINQVNIANPKPLKSNRTQGIIEQTSTGPLVAPKINQAIYRSSGTPVVESTGDMGLTDSEKLMPSTNSGGIGLGLSLGDMISLGANYMAGTMPMNNTLKNRASDTPNINAFADYGKDTLNKMDEMKSEIQSITDNQLQDAELTRGSSITRNRNSARGINTQRALDLVTDAGINQGRRSIMNQGADRLMQLLGQEASFLAQKDNVVMSGDQAKDLADRQDKDNFYSQMGQDIAGLIQATRQTGKDLNQNKLGNTQMNLLDLLSDKYGYTIDKNGNMKKTKGKLKDSPIMQGGSLKNNSVGLSLPDVDTLSQIQALLPVINSGQIDLNSLLPSNVKVTPVKKKKTK